MAQLLYERHSTKIHLNTTRRHMRLCRQIKGSEQYATLIEPHFKDLEDKQRITENARISKESARDDVTLCDNVLDNSIRTLNEKAKQYDRENPGRPVLIQLFPDGKLNTIINAPIENEPDVADLLVARLESLGGSHSLNDQGPVLRSNIEKCRNALQTYHSSINLIKNAEAQEEISKSNLRRQYEFNYLDISKQLGKIVANRLFPAISSSSKGGNGDTAPVIPTETKTS